MLATLKGHILTTLLTSDKRHNPTIVDSKDSGCCHKGAQELAGYVSYKRCPGDVS